MKKLLGFLILFFAISFNSFSQTGAATASAQARSNLLLVYGVDKADSIITALVRSNLLLTRDNNKLDSLYTAIKTFTNVSVLSLPSNTTNLSTSANQVINYTYGKYNANKLDSLYTGVKTFTNVSVINTATNINVNSTVTALPSNTTNLATSANQTTLNTYQKYVNDKLDSLITINTAISNSTLTGLSVSSQITYTNAFVTKASTGVLYGCSGYNSKATAQFITFYNLTAIPADGVAPFIASFTVPALSNFSYSTGIFGIPFSTGIVWSNSSTSQTKTIGSSDIQITVISK